MRPLDGIGETAESMNRRSFIRGTASTMAVGALALEQPWLEARAAAQAPGAAAPLPRTLRGVNLGSWLVLEKWMVPSVFRGARAGDEFGLCSELGAGAAARLNEHRERFITADDFAWIKARGLNAVRLPVGFWALQAPAPWVECSKYLDFAFEQARLNGLQILLDLHGSPGSQNGMDHSGRSGEVGWHKSAANIEATIVALEGLARRYGKHPSLWGIELLNEPRWDVPIGILKSYYQDAYKRIRPLMPANVAIVIHDGFRPFEWKDFMTEPGYSNVLLDTHLYQAYTDADRKRTPQEHIAEALGKKKHLDAMAGQLWTMVGEWSLGTPGEVWRGQSPFQIEVSKRAYGDAQLLSYESSKGWFYWSYKLEDAGSDWSFRTCVERGWLPSKFDL